MLKQNLIQERLGALLENPADNFKEIMALFRLNYNPNVANLKGETLLHWLVKVREPLGLRSFNLLRYSPNYRNPNFDTIKELVMRGGNVNFPNQEGKTPFQLLLDNRNAAEGEMMRFVVELKADPSAKSSAGQTLLHMFVMRNKYTYDDSSSFSSYLYPLEDHIKKLVQQKHVSVQVENDQQQTPLRYLLDSNGGRDTNFAYNAELLITLGADPETRSTRGQTLLHALVTGNTLKTVYYGQQSDTYILDDYIKRIVKYVNVAIQNTDGQTPLECLLEGPSYNAKFTHNAMLLLSLGADPATKSTNGHTLIDFLAANNENGSNDKAIEELIKKYSADVLGGDYSDKKKIIAPLETYAYPNKISFFGRQHVAVARSIIELIIAAKEFAVVEELLSSQLDYISQCFLAVRSQDGSSQVDDRFANNPEMKVKMGKHTKPEESGYFKALTASLEVFRTISSQRQQEQTNDNITSQEL